MSSASGAAAAAAGANAVFVSTSRFKSAIALLNQTDVSKLTSVLTTLLNRMTERKGSGAVFNDTERNALKTALELSSEALDTFIGGCSYIWDQAAFYNLTPEKLELHLKEHDLIEEAIAVFKAVWAAGRLAYVNALRERTLGAPLVLKDIDWRLQITMANTTLANTKTLSSLLDLTLGEPDSGNSSGAPVEHLLIEFSKEQLTKLYDDLERVQVQLDNLAK